MPDLKRWEIPHLSRVRKFDIAACRILAYRLRTALDFANSFKQTREAETLHQLRIALRRLRYPLETLLSRFKRKTMLRFIEEVNALQDAAGAARDLDVLLERLRRDDVERHWMLRKIVFLDLEEERKKAYKEALDSIDFFLVSPVLYDFKQEIDFENTDPVACVAEDPVADESESSGDEADAAWIGIAQESAADEIADESEQVPFLIPSGDDGGDHETRIPAHSDSD